MIDYLRKLSGLFDKRVRIKFAGLFVLMLIGALLEMVGVGLFLPVLQLVATPEKIAENQYLSGFHNALGGDIVRSFAVGSALLLAFFTVKAVLSGIFIHIQNRFVYGQMCDLSTAQLRGYSNQNYAFHLDRNSADFIRNIMISVAVVFGSGVLALLSIALELLLTLGVLSVMIFVDPSATLIAVGILGGALGLWYVLVRERLLRWGQFVQDSSRNMIVGVNQTVGGLKEAMVLGRRDHFLDAFEVSARRNSVNRAKLGTVGQLPRLIGEVVVIASAMIIVGLILDRTDRIMEAVPVAGVFAVAAMRILPSVSRIFAGFGRVRQSIPALNDLYADLIRVEQAEQNTAKDRDNFRPFNYEIRLDNVSYAYPGSETPSLRGISMAIRKGETVGLVGRSGAGKTTLADVILGLLKPVSGEVQMDGLDIQKDLRSWQRGIGYVPQEIYLCDDTIRNNIAFGIASNEIDSTRIDTVLKQAHLEEVVASLPNGVDTAVGERGVRLSGGQRQRIGIARALYHEPDVIVLDEATSSLDSLAEKNISEAIDSLKGIKTIIVIAHRLSTVKNCDRIMLLEDGAVAGEGTYQELSTSNALFKHIANFPDETEVATAV